jgi:hypothetical protein
VVSLPAMKFLYIKTTLLLLQVTTEEVEISEAWARIFKKDPRRWFHRIDSLRESIPSWNGIDSPEGGGRTPERSRFQLQNLTFMEHGRLDSILGSYSIPGIDFSSHNLS